MADSKETLIIKPDEKGVIGIDVVRSLKRFLWQKPANSKLRTVIIREAENLTNPAQSASLKIVEEPPESALIIFIAKNIENLLPTLTSRIQKVHFPKNADERGFMRTLEADLRGKGVDKAQIIDDNYVDRFFENLINDLKKDPITNSQRLKEILKRLTLIKQFNVNKRLQIKAVQSL